MFEFADVAHESGTRSCLPTGIRIAVPVSNQHVTPYVDRAAGAPGLLMASRIVATVLLIWGADARPANACSCSANPPCAAVWKADAVFVGTVVDRSPERLGGSLSWTVYKVAVGQPLRGSVDSFITLVPGHRPTDKEIAASQSHPGELMAGSSCDYDFEVGKQYLIYARQTSDGRWTTARCTGTKPVEHASADLDYIATLPAAATTGRVYGTVERTVLNPDNRFAAIGVPAADVAVAVVNDTHRLTTVTDMEGKLDVQVPPGEYTIAPILPDTVRVYGAPHRASVPARGCAPVHFSITSNGRIEGRVVRSDGRPASHTSVDVIPADMPPGERQGSSVASPSGSTDANGRFSVDGILPGRYVVAVNARFGARLDAPYPTTYFPGGGRQTARVVDMGEGERKTGFTIVVNPLRETTLSGVVVFDDDQPAMEASVTAAPLDHRFMSMGSARADSSGAFELRLLSGISYLVRAGIRTADGFRQTETVVFVDQRTEGLGISIAR